MEAIIIIIEDYYCMRRALYLAKKGLGRTSPNPMVGCVIVKDNRIIGEGWHHECGANHAEIEALNDAKKYNEDVRGATVYVTLEPCSHYGRTPPCAQRLVSEGVARVVYAMTDPNPKVNGQGLQILRDAGIETQQAAREFENQAKFLNRGFIFVQKYNRPFITLKAAMSLDGKMCLDNNSSKWITGIKARTKAHKLRSENDAVLVGVNTILQDDPQLTVRHVKGIDPLRVILDSNLRTPINSRVIANDNKCLILTSENADESKIKSLQDAGARVAKIESQNNHINIKSALEYLVTQNVLTLMIEGGPEILSSFLREKFADYVNLFIAPKIFGEGRGFDLRQNFNSVNEAFNLNIYKSIRHLDKDIFIEGWLSCSQDL